MCICMLFMCDNCCTMDDGWTCFSILEAHFCQLFLMFEGAHLSCYMFASICIFKYVTYVFPTDIDATIYSPGHKAKNHQSQRIAFADVDRSWLACGNDRHQPWNSVNTAPQWLMQCDGTVPSLDLSVLRQRKKCAETLIGQTLSAFQIRAESQTQQAAETQPCVVEIAPLQLATTHAETADMSVS